MPRRSCLASSKRRHVWKAPLRDLVVIAFSASLAACSARSTSAAEAVSPESRRLDGQLLAMIDRRERDSSLVDALLRDREPARRARAALAIGQVQMQSRYSLLRRLLVDADTAVAANAAFALGLAKDSGSVIALGRALAGAPDVVAREAAWALGEIGEPARAMLMLALGDGIAQPLITSSAAQRSGMVRAELLLATTKLRAVPANVITPWLVDQSVEAVRAAAYAIARPRLSAGVRAMLPLARHADELVRQHVARALARNSVPDSLVARARDAIAALVMDTSPRVRANAVRSLASYGTGAQADVQRALTDRDANVRVAVAENIGTAFGRDVAAWRRAWMADSTFTVRRSLLSGARREGSDALASAESLWTTGSDWRERSAVIEARSLDPRIERVSITRRFIGDTDGRVRAAAMALLDTASLRSSEARGWLQRGLRDIDAQVRAGALRGLARRASGEELPAVLDLLPASDRASGSGDPEDDVRNAALRYIAAAWLRDSARVTDATRARLAVLPPASTASDRALVARVTPLAHWRLAPLASTVRPAGDYERMAQQWLRPGARLPVVVLRTDRGDITVELLAADAPLVVESFLRLARSDYYRDSWFHRVVPNFVAQDGNPRGDGSGGPAFSLRDSWTRQRHDRGAIGLATAGPDTGSSQYYLCHSPQPHLDGHYTVFGRVLSGLDVMDALVQGDRLRSVEIR